MMIHTHLLNTEASNAYHLWGVIFTLSPSLSLSVLRSRGVLCNVVADYGVDDNDDIAAGTCDRVTFKTLTCDKKSIAFAYTDAYRIECVCVCVRLCQTCDSIYYKYILHYMFIIKHDLATISLVSVATRMCAMCVCACTSRTTPLSKPCDW